MCDKAQDDKRRRKEAGDDELIIATPKEMLEGALKSWLFDGDGIGFAEVLDGENGLMGRCCLGDLAKGCPLNLSHWWVDVVIFLRGKY